jgi:hypothetical protein
MGGGVMEPQQGMTQQQVESLLQHEISDALTHINTTDSIAAERQRNYEYYNSIMDDMPAPPKRSQVIEPTVSTYINMLLPSLMRVFTSARVMADFQPRPGVPPELVKLASRFVSEIVMRKDNDITRLFYQWFFDAVVQKNGIAMAWWDTRTEYREDTFENLSDDEFAGLLQSNPNAQVAGHTEASAMQTTPLGTFQVRTHSVTLKSPVDKSKVCIENVPPEDFCISRDARTLEDAILKSRRYGALVGDLAAEGYPLEELKKLPTHRTNSPWSRRYAGARWQIDAPRDTKNDPLLREVTVHEGIIHCDYDGTGLRDWYFKAAGGDSKVMLMQMEAYDYQVVFADLCPNPLPHQFFGRCPADDLAGVQRVQTAITRQYLDALYLSNTPQREVVQDWIIRPDQLMNMAPGAPVLVKQPGAIREIQTADVSQSALAGLQYFEGIAEQRSGITRQSAGMDADTLQKQLATTALLAQAASTGKVEMIARLFADGGVTKLFRGVLNILARYQTFSRAVQFANEDAQIDPRQWAALIDADVSINTGLGTGSRERDLNFVASIIGMQEKVVTELGGPNPIVTPKHVYNALDVFAEATGLPNPERFFGDPRDWTPQPPPPTPDPNTVVLAQVEQAKIQKDAAKEAAKIESDERIAQAEIASRERIAFAQEETKRLTKGADLELRDAESRRETAVSGMDNLAKSVDDLSAKVKTAAAQAESGATLAQLAQAVDGIKDAVNTMGKPRRLKRDPKTGDKMVVIDQ